MAPHAGVFTQLMVVVTAYGAKPVYMLLSLALIVVLWRQQAGDLRLLRWALLTFLVGETACAADHLFLGDPNDLLEVLHGAGMVGMGAFSSWAVYEFADKRLTHYADPERPCSAIRFCGACWKREPVSCFVHRTFLFAAPCLAIMSLLPFCAPLRPEGVTLLIFGTPVFYGSTPWALAAQARIFPALAGAGFLLAFALLLAGRRGLRPSLGPFFAATGLMGFSLLRFVLTESFRVEPPWGEIWEELTELVAVAFIAFFLWVTRKQLLRHEQASRSSGSAG